MIMRFFLALILTASALELLNAQETTTEPETQSVEQTGDQDKAEQKPEQKIENTTRKKSSEPFKPSEKISEDAPVSFPIDI